MDDKLIIIAKITPTATTHSMYILTDVQGAGVHRQAVVTLSGPADCEVFVLHHSSAPLQVRCGNRETKDEE